MIGDIISHYRIIEKLGEGGMGVVYKAQDLRLDRYVALKFLPTDLHSADEIARLEQEAKAVSALNHPSIATIYDVDESDRNRFLVLEFISGGTLKSRIRQFGSAGRELSLKEIVDTGIQIAEGLAHAHRNGIVHRDIKTENMMLTSEGNVKITDFGLAKLRGGAQLTRTGTTVGTAPYMSPEQVRGEALDHRTDLFSFGIVLYELATGSYPFRGEHEAAVAYAIVNEDPISLRSVRPSLPEAFQRIIQRCLEKDIQKRYQSADEIVADLRSLQSGGSNGTIETSRHWASRWILFGIAGIVLAGAIIFLWPRSSSTVDRKSIAVLPFENLSEGRENEYFSDGVTEDIIAQLSKIGDLKVISRTSVMQYKNSAKSLKEIARELNVATVLEGSVRKAGNEIRIVAELIDARSDEHIWAETYDREMTQIFAIQSDVAGRIADALKAKLSPSEKARLVERGTDNLTAYNAYLRAEYHWNKITKQDLQTAISYYNDAIRSDPRYARAYAGLSIAYSLTAYFRYDFIDAQEAVTKAREAALSALQLNPNLAEAHTALAYILRTYDWNFPRAEEELKKSIELNPNYSIARDFYAILLAALGRFNEATAQSNLAVELDPLSIEVLHSRARIEYYAGRYDEAIALTRKEFEVDPESRPAHGLLGSIYEMKHLTNKALSEIILSRSITGTDYEGYSEIRKSGDSPDWKSYWNRELTVAKELCGQGQLPYIVLSVVALRANQREFAIQSLQKSYEKREGSLVYLNVEPLFEPLRTDPRIIAILRNMNLQ